jgi:DNA polymerase I
MSSIKDNEPEALFQEEQTDKKLKIVVDNDHLKPDTSEMTLLVDADTVAYATCSACEYGDDESGWFIDLPSALIVAQEKVALLLELSGCKDVELHFTSGKNFRYLLTDTYKSNRSSTRYPEGLREMKDLLEGTINTDYEADDIVCMLKREYPDKYIVCAVDKDVLNGVPGIHFNYYNSLKYNINMKWLVTDEETSTQWPYLQCLMGDSADGITGIKGVGPAKAKKLLLGITDETIMWNTVKQAYTDAGQEESEALLNMRLVHMHQLTKEKTLELWCPPEEV